MNKKDLIWNVLNEDWSGNDSIHLRNKLSTNDVNVSDERTRQAALGHEALQAIVNWHLDMGICISCDKAEDDICPICDIVQRFRSGKT